MVRMGAGELGGQGRRGGGLAWGKRRSGKEGKGRKEEEEKYTAAK